MLTLLRMIGIFNAAIWLGSALFFTFGVAPGVFSPEMKKVFGDEYTSFIGQQLIGRYFTVNLVCCLVAIGHFAAEIIYAGKPFRRFTFALLVGMLAIGVLGGYVFSPRIKQLAHQKYRGPVEQRPVAAADLKRLHAMSMIGNTLSLLALVIYLWQAANPADPMRFVGSGKFRG